MTAAVRLPDVDSPPPTPAEVAAHCRVSAKTALRAIRSGTLRAARFGSRRAYRVEPAWIAACEHFTAGGQRDQAPRSTAPRPASSGAKAFEGKVRTLKRSAGLAQLDAGTETFADFAAEW